MAVQQMERAKLLQSEQECDECAGEISVDELWAEIDQKAHQYFNISGQDFARLYQQGALTDNFAVAELGFLLRCIDDSFIPA